MTGMHGLHRDALSRWQAELDSPRVVAMGGGHGLAASLQALRHVTDRLTAVVTVADDGGSSGRLRQEMDVIPPGDLRQALSALCDDAAWGQLWKDVLQHRFTSDGPMHGHACGNLLIVTLWQLLQDPVAGLDLVGRLLGARGRVLPMATVPLDIEADVRFAGGRQEVVRGQHRVAATDGLVGQVRLVPADVPATAQAVEAINEADWVVLGPGSFYTSVMPHLLLPGMREAVINSTARICLLMNLTADGGETSGLTPGDHLRALSRHAPDMRLDVVIADPHSVDDISDLTAAAECFGGILVLRQLATVQHTDRHDPLRLAAALQDMMDQAFGDCPR